MNLIFFGSFQHYSALVLKSLIEEPDINVVAVITTPPSPLGRKKVLTKNPVHLLADQFKIPVHTPKTLNTSIPQYLNTSSPDFFVVAGYGKILPKPFLDYPKYGCLNLHFSFLPKFRGANPAEWAILLGETVTGVSLIHMDTGIDTGPIIARESIPISPKDTRETLYHKLYQLGADHLPFWLKRHYNWQQKQDFYCQQSLAPEPQPKTSPTPTAYRFTRDDGFIDWRIIQAAMDGKPYDTNLLKTHLKTAYDFLSSRHPSSVIRNLEFLERAARALSGFPTLWTLVPTTKGNKRLKLLKTHFDRRTPHLELDEVQLEGLQPTTFNQIKNQIFAI